MKKADKELHQMMQGHSPEALYQQNNELVVQGQKASCPGCLPESESEESGLIPKRQVTKHGNPFHSL